MPSMIISASRRTDIPAFYMPWFMNRLRVGSASYPNPFSGALHSVSLLPEDVHSIVFWSKYYGPFLDYSDELQARDYRFVCHYTITGSPRELEPHVPRWEAAIKVFHALAERTSPRHVLWRFDPIVALGDAGQVSSPSEGGGDLGERLIRFREIARALAGHTERCYFSFASYYGKVQRRMQKANIPYCDPPLEAKQALVEQMADCADECGITLHACCQDALLSDRVQKAHCVDGDLLAQLFPDRPHVTQANPTREQCGCVTSRDIGMYDTCPYGCVYCYANANHAAAVKHRQQHDPMSETLVKK
ncbi:MAG: DUF1848 domain-containing protein [Anaerolineae bacterium]|nr:DUF1848 domain-containing protein [Anaerolineae bacterium]